MSAMSARSRPSRASSSGSPPNAPGSPCTCSIASMLPADSAMIDKARVAEARELKRQGRLPLLMRSRRPLLKRLPWCLPTSGTFRCSEGLAQNRNVSTDQCNIQERESRRVGVCRRAVPESVRGRNTVPQGLRDTAGKPVEAMQDVQNTQKPAW